MIQAVKPSKPIHVTALYPDGHIETNKHVSWSDANYDRTRHYLSGADKVCFSSSPPAKQPPKRIDAEILALLASKKSDVRG